MILDLPPVTYDEVLSALTPSEYMELGMEPQVEVEDTSTCPSRWHIQEDWHTYCSYKIPGYRTAFVPGCDIKSQHCEFPPEFFGLGGGSVGSFWSTPAWRGTDSGISATHHANGFSGGGSSSGFSNDEDTTVICYGDICVVCGPTPPTPDQFGHEPEPAPVPIPATGWLLGAALIWLFRRTRK
jgi:hypothetical protein